MVKSSCSTRTVRSARIAGPEPELESCSTNPPYASAMAFTRSTARCTSSTSTDTDAREMVRRWLEISDAWPPSTGSGSAIIPSADAVFSWAIPNSDPGTGNEADADWEDAAAISAVSSAINAADSSEAPWPQAASSTMGNSAARTSHPTAVGRLIRLTAKAAPFKQNNILIPCPPPIHPTKKSVKLPRKSPSDYGKFRGGVSYARVVCWVTVLRQESREGFSISSSRAFTRNPPAP